MDQPDKTDRVDLDDDGQVDDVAVWDCSLFRLERMSDDHVWIRVYRENSPDLVFQLGSKTKIDIMVEEE